MIRCMKIKSYKPLPAWTTKNLLLNLNAVVIERQILHSRIALNECIMISEMFFPCQLKPHISHMPVGKLHVVGAALALGNLHCLF